MSKSKYMTWMTESFLYDLYEDDDSEGEGRINMDDPVMQKTGWAKKRPDLTVGGALKQGPDYEFYDDAKDIVAQEKGGSGGKEKETGSVFKATGTKDKADKPKVDKPKPDKPKGERPTTIHLDYDQADDDLDDLRYAGSLSDNPSLVDNISDMVKVMQSGHATDDDVQRATDVVDTMNDMDMTNPDAGVEDMSMALQSSIDAHVKGGVKEFNEASPFSDPLPKGRDSKGNLTDPKDKKLYALRQKSKELTAKADKAKDFKSKQPFLKQRAKIQQQIAKLREFKRNTDLLNKMDKSDNETFKSGDSWQTEDGTGAKYKDKTRYFTGDGHEKKAQKYARTGKTEAKNSGERTLKEQYDRLFTNRTVI